MENLYSKADKIGAFWKTSKADEDLSRYIPNILPVTRQNQIAGTIPRKAFASVTYSDKKILEFVLELTVNTYSNYSSMELVLPIQFTKSTNNAAQMDGNIITVNNFFGHWITDIDIRRYPDDKRILPTNNNVDVYQFSNTQMKYLLKDSFATLLKSFLYSNRPVYLDGNVDRRLNNSDDVNKRSDPNLTYRIADLKDLFFLKKYYSISLGMLVDLVFVNFAMKADTKFIYTLKRSMNKLFETTKKAIPDEPDALIQFHDRPYILYEEISLTKTFDVYLSGILRAETA